MARPARGLYGAIVGFGLLAGLAGCGTASEFAAETPAAAVESPSALVGLWRVVGVRGENPDTALRFGADSFELLRPCGASSGDWVARPAGGLFAAQVFFTGTGCVTGAPDRQPNAVQSALRATPGWLLEVARFRVDAGRPELLDASGRVVAHLQAISSLPGADVRSPALLPGERAALDAAAPAMPDGMTPALPEDLLGRWETAAPPGCQVPYLAFRSDGVWLGSDGSNDLVGHYSAADGLLAATQAMSGLTGCGVYGPSSTGRPNNAQVGAWIGAARICLDRGELVLLEADGREVARLHRP